MPRCPRRPKKSDLGKRGGWMEPRGSRIVKFTLPERHMFVTEGTKTEPSYINGLIAELAEKLGNEVKNQITIYPEGTNTLFLLEKAERYLQNEADAYQHVWIMFDLDDFPRDRFDNVQFRCQALNDRNRENGHGPMYHAIWSNQCFELWVLLHFVALDSAIERSDYYDKISNHLKAQGLCEKYEKEDENIFSYLRPKLKKAIKNAQRLEEKFKDEPPSKSDPCTKVHHLFDEDAFGQYIL